MRKLCVWAGVLGLVTISFAALAHGGEAREIQSRVKVQSLSENSAPPVLPMGSNLGYQTGAGLLPLSADVLKALSSGPKGTEKGRFQVGIVRALEQPIVVNGASAPPSQWQTVANGWRVWSASVTSAGALGLRVHLESVSLPVGARLVIYDPSNPQGKTISVTSKELTKERDVWAATLFSEQVVIECQVPPGTDTSAVSFTIAEVSHTYRLPYSQSTQKDLAESCEKDVTCYPAWHSDSLGVALIDFFDNGGEFYCTGCLLNSVNTSSSASYFLTANHCIHSQASASSIIFYWFYQTSSCNGSPPDLGSVPSTVGGQLLAHSTNSDFSFMSLKQSPPNGVTYLGWSIGMPNSTEKLTVIHHPKGDFKRLSQGQLYDLDSDFWYVQWSLGVTEPGSSGSPLFNSQHQVIGQLYGGNSDCTNPTGVDEFGRFDISYLSFSQWLDPGFSIASAKGTYTGLFSDPNAAQPQSSGAFTLTVTTKGTFTGSLKLENARYPFKGQFAAGGTAETTAKRGALDIQLSIDTSNNTGQVTGTVSNGTWTATLLGNLSVFNARTNIAPEEGKYTMVIAANGDPSTAPGGYSYGTITVDKAGHIHFVGSLADGTAVTQSAVIAQDGSWPFYLALYRSQGMAIGWLNIQNTQGQAVSGNLNWQKPVLANTKFYSAGFNYNPSVNGSVYTTPQSGAAILPFANAQLALTGGNLAAEQDYQMTFSSTTRLKSSSANSANMNINRGNGVVTGRAATGQKAATNLRGVVLQGSTNILGYFLGTDESGSVSVTGE